MGKYVSCEHQSIIHGIVKKYWDFFARKGHSDQSLTMNFQSTQAHQNLRVVEIQDMAHMNSG